VTDETRRQVCEEAAMKNQLLGVLSAASLLSCSPISCIARGTLVWTPRGLRRIDELIEQDTVWCVDPATGEHVASPITAVKSAKREVMRLSGETFSLSCTTDHPLYDPLARTWAPAGDWVLGQRASLLLVPEDGSTPRVVAVTGREVAAGVCEVFDLTVAHALHNFVAGRVLVHNKTIRLSCPAPDGGSTFGGDRCICADAGAGTTSCEVATNGEVSTACSCER
jgi:hypothetical protein